MANILGVITAILLAVSAFLAMKNKDRYQTEIDNTKTEKAKLADTQKKLKATIADKEQTIATRKGVEEDIVGLETDKSTQERSNADLKTQSDAKTAEIGSNQQKIDEIRDKTKALGDLKDLSGKMKIAREEIDALKTNIEQAETKLANLTAQTNSTQSSVSSLSTKITTLTSGRSLPSLRTTIRSIYPTWGFVTLGAGNNAGVVNNSTLNVVRDGNTVAKLLVTAVESNRASANIVPDSLAEDITLTIGDRVMAEEPPVAKAPAPAPASAPVAADDNTPAAPAEEAAPEAPAASDAEQSEPADNADPFGN